MIKTISLKVRMDCANCAQNIQRALRKLPLADLTVDVVAQLVAIEYDPSAVSQDEIMRAMRKTGYEHELV